MIENDEITHTEVVRLRKEFNEIGDTLSKARNAIHHADKLMESAHFMGKISDELGMKSGGGTWFVDTVRMYVEGYLNGLEKLVHDRKENDQL